MTAEEANLLKKLSSGALDGLVGDELTTSSGSSVWSEIKNGIPTRYKQGPGGKIFNGKENERFSGKLHKLQEWETDLQKLDFLQKYGWLMEDADVNEYSAKFKPKR